VYGFREAKMESECQHPAVFLAGPFKGIKGFLAFSVFDL